MRITAQPGCRNSLSMQFLLILPTGDQRLLPSRKPLIRRENADTLSLRFLLRPSGIPSPSSSPLSCVCVVITFSRLGINRVWLPILLVVSRTGKINFPCPCSRLRVRVRLSHPASARSFSTPRLKLVLTHGTPLLPPAFLFGFHQNRIAPSGRPD